MKQLIVACAVAVLALGAFAAQNYVGPAGQVAWSNDSGANVSSGDLVDIGIRYGVALADITTNEVGTVVTEGRFKFLHSATTAVTRGNSAYFVTATTVTATASSGKYVGEFLDTVALALTPQWLTVDLNAYYPVTFYDAVVTNGTIVGLTNTITWQTVNVRP